MFRGKRAAFCAFISLAEESPLSNETGLRLKLSGNQLIEVPKVMAVESNG